MPFKLEEASSTSRGAPRSTARGENPQSTRQAATTKSRDGFDRCHREQHTSGAKAPCRRPMRPQMRASTLACEPPAKLPCRAPGCRRLRQPKMASAPTQLEADPDPNHNTRQVS
eukprot:CAMPEP_0183578034 /NCGR_PEP_ID=MMETSP0371-20130417/141007_1 /TAXON_ID=268820 /ORGANISM="Peridinium aciculiferum, Strain PAER-2" /LENGTH=113 /DNA_ID=CAMNT_0025788423 /DNA_START=158 /DNA_END=499 /DNA_ORIENTATION=+